MALCVSRLPVRLSLFKRATIVADRQEHSRAGFFATKCYNYLYIFYCFCSKHRLRVRSVFVRTASLTDDSNEYLEQNICNLNNVYIPLWPPFYIYINVGI